MFTHLISVLAAANLAIAQPAAKVPTGLGAGCAAGAHATLVFQRDAATPSLTTGNCDAEFEKMYDALDNYEFGVAALGVSWLVGPGGAALAALNVIYNGHKVDVAESRLNACLAKK